MLKAFPQPGREFDTGVVTAAVIRMFCDYREEAVLAVSDPVNGLPSKLRYFPTIAEVKAALEQFEMPRRVREAAEERIRETTRLLGAPQQEISQEARDRAFEAWQAQKKEMSGKKTPEQERAEANALLRDGWRDKRWDCRVNPVKISDALRRNLEAKAKPGYVSLEVGQAQQGKRDDD